MKNLTTPSATDYAMADARRRAESSTERGIAPTFTYSIVGSAGRVNLVVNIDGHPPFTDRLDIASATARGKFLDSLCKRWPGIGRGAAQAELERIAAEVAARPCDSRKGDDREPTREELLAVKDEAADAALEAMPESAREEAEAMLAAPTLIDLIHSDIAGLGVVGESDLAFAVYLIGTSRLDEKPLGGIVQAPSSCGKSFVLESVASLFPEEAVLRATDMTPQALYYVPAGTLIHRWVLAGERCRNQDDERADATRAMREMLSAGELRKLIAIGNPKGGVSTASIHQHGPIAFTESTTLTRIFDEDANRCLLLGADEREEQTRRILAEQARRASGHVVTDPTIVPRHHALQRMLRRVKVVIPFAARIAEAMPKSRPEARRAMPHVLSMIRAVATLHQRQRADGELGHGDTITATISDYAAARGVLIGPMGRALGGALTPAVERFGRWLQSHYGRETFSASEALRDGKLSSKGKVSEYLRALADAGAVECVEESRGSKAATWRVIGAVPEGGALWLPDPGSLGGA